MAHVPNHPRCARCHPAQHAASAGTERGWPEAKVPDAPDAPSVGELIAGDRVAAVDTEAASVVGDARVLTLAGQDLPGGQAAARRGAKGQHYTGEALREFAGRANVGTVR